MSVDLPGVGVEIVCVEGYAWSEADAHECKAFGGEAVCGIECAAGVPLDSFEGREFIVAQ